MIGLIFQTLLKWKWKYEQRRISTKDNVSNRTGAARMKAQDLLDEVEYTDEEQADLNISKCLKDKNNG